MQKFLEVYNKYYFWLVLFLFVFIPLYPKFPLENVSGTFVAIRLDDILVAIVIGIWAISLVLSGKWKSFLSDKLTNTFLVFFFIGALSIFSASFVTHTISPHLGLFHFLRRPEFMLLLPVGYSSLKTKKQLFYLLWVLGAVTFIVCLYGFGQKYFHLPVISTNNSEFSKGLILYLTPGARVNSTFAGHYDLAVYLSSVLVMLTALFFYFRKLYTKIYIILIGIFSTFILFLTASRTSFLAALLGAIFSLIFIKKKMFVLLLTLVAVIALIFPSPLRDRFLSTITVNLGSGGNRFNATTAHQQSTSQFNIPTLPGIPSNAVRFATNSATPSGVASDITPGEPTDQTQLEVYRSFGIRFNVEWPRAIRAFVKNPLLGTGYSSISLATDNDFLRLLGEVGILGTFAFSLVIIEIIKRLKSGFNCSDRLVRFLSEATLALVISFLINGIFIDVFEASKLAELFWLFLGLILAAIKFI